MEQYSDQIMVITRTESANLEVLITHTPNKSSRGPPKSKLKSVLPFMRTICFGLILHQGLKRKLPSLLVQSQKCSNTRGTKVKLQHLCQRGRQEQLLLGCFSQGRFATPKHFPCGCIGRSDSEGWNASGLFLGKTREDGSSAALLPIPCSPLCHWNA